MPLSAGTRLGTYEIELLVGTGGLGEVYRAHDTRLGRTRLGHPRIGSLYVGALR